MVTDGENDWKVSDELRAHGFSLRARIAPVMAGGRLAFLIWKWHAVVC